MNKEDKQKENQQYIESLIKRLQDGGSDLTDVERSLGNRFMASRQRAMDSTKEAEALEKDIRVRQSQLEQLRDKISMEMGKGAGIMESIVALRPEDPGANGEKKDRPRPNVGKKAGEGAEA